MTNMTPAVRPSLEELLEANYSLELSADPAGGFAVSFPDLPGCITQVDTLEEVPSAATEIRTLWITAQFEDGFPIPEPSLPEEHSGKFNVRISKSLHRRLAASARREGVSLNQYVMSLLDKSDALARLEQRFDALDARLTAIDAQLRYRVSGAPSVPTRRASFAFEVVRAQAA